MFQPLQLKKFCRKGCQLYAAHILETSGDETPRLEDYQVLQEFEVVFSDEILGLPPRGTLISPLNLC